MALYTMPVLAQQTIELEKTISPFKSDTLIYLGDWVLEETIKVYTNDTLVSNNAWKFNPLKGEWTLQEAFRPQFEGVPSVIIRYQAYPLALRRVTRNRSLVIADSSFLSNQGDTVLVSNTVTENRRANIFDSSELNQSGSLSRGVIVGTNQDFALESGLQFELNGKLTDDVSITASLTDRSLPIQPDGSTQNLREFDRVFIELQSSATTFQIGDVDLSLQQSEFGKINRRLQGANADIRSGVGNYKGALSVARGKFRLINFRGQDGVQGPYRLTGENGEEFVIVLAGSEKVYIDGRRVNRGEENEYIIDYGLGELVFTKNYLVTDESRIVVEYQYLDQDFTRTLAAAEGRSDELLNGKLSIGATFIREADGDNLLSQRALNEQEIALLRNVGDDLSRAVVSGADSVDITNDIDQVLYAEVDTVFNGQTFRIFRNIPGSDQAVFSVRFTRVEDGEGDYARVSRAVNGLLFEWVGPGNGNYVPFRQLSAPILQQMATIDATYKINDKISLFGEWAGSFFDQNRFSDFDDSDNTDVAYITGIQILPSSIGAGEIGLTARRRFSGGNFRFFDRTRDVEFVRKWNIRNFDQSEEELNEAQLQYNLNSALGSTFEYGQLKRFGFESERQAFSLRTTERQSFYLDYQQDWVQSETEQFNEKGSWFRHKGESGYNTTLGSFNVRPGIRFEQEERRQRTFSTDSLLNTSFAFLEVGPGVRIENDRLRLGASFSYRLDELVEGNTLTKASSAIEQRYSVSYQPSTFITTSQEVALRNRTFTDSFQNLGNANRRGILVRSNTQYQLKSEALRGSFFYEANTERKALLQETYIEVGPDLGLFVWRDDNNDGVQQLDEFFPEVSPNEGTFVRQFLPSDELFPIIELNVRLRNTVNIFRPVSPKGTWLGEVELRSRVDVLESSTTQNLRDVYLLQFSTFRNENETIQGRVFIDKELGLFPANNDYDLDIGYSRSIGLNRRSTEVQNLFTEMYRVSANYQSSWRYTFSFNGNLSVDKNDSDRLFARNFDIRSFEMEPGFRLAYSRSFSTTYSVNYARKEDRSPVEAVTADIYKIKADSRGFIFNSIQSNVLIEWRNASVQGRSSSLGIFELTDGTGIGKNLIWSVNASYNISRLVRLTFNYDGRTVRNAPSIHTGKLTISAIF